MNDFIKNASAEMTENYNISELFPKKNDKVLPDEKQDVWFSPDISEMNPLRK